MKARSLLLIFAAVLATGSAWLLFRSAPEGATFARVSSPVVKAPQQTSTVPESPLDETKALASAKPGSSALFSYVKRPAYADAFEKNCRAPSTEVRYVRMNRELLEGKRSPLWLPAGQGKLSISLPDGTQVTSIVDSSDMLDASRFSSQGHIEGQPASRVLITGNAGGQYSAVLLDVEVNDGTGVKLKNYSLRATGGEEGQFYEVIDALVPGCGGQVSSVVDADAISAAAARKTAADSLGSSNTDSTSTATTVADTNGNVIVDLMMVYSPSVMDKYTGTQASNIAALTSAFDAVVAQTNTDFTRSGIHAQVRLVKSSMVTYTETTSATGRNEAALSALRLTSDGIMDDVHTMRSDSGADLVCLILGKGDSVSAGIGYLLEIPSVLRSSPPTGTDASMIFYNDAYAFSVVSFDYMQGTAVVTHELGHNFGAQHDRANAVDTSGVLTQGAYSYSYGYKFTGKDNQKYCTIMAYTNNTSTRVHYFSNPDVVAQESTLGVAVGVAAGQTGEANNALTLNNTAFEVSNFRKQLQTTFYSGRMLGLSTRAYVGPGDQQLIGGIAISGTQPKRVILRALGPSMTSVSNVLADPILTIHNPTLGTVVATNDDWGSAANKADMLTASRALYLNDPANAKEAAVLLTLSPGAYTANIEGVGGATGTALMEAYEADPSGDQHLLGLSTRGYANTTDKVMIAGMLIKGNVGETKRVIIRVLGPTLTKSGVSATSAMNDPLLELHGADGSLLLTCDDWTSGATYVGGVRDDFQPVTTLYTETELSKTGFAPSNRREPAVMLDLIPGLYTVFAKPFEKLSTDSTQNQPASPGVALIEVYEVNSSGKVN